MAELCLQCPAAVTGIIRRFVVGWLRNLTLFTVLLSRSSFVLIKICSPSSRYLPIWTWEPLCTIISKHGCHHLDVASIFTSRAHRQRQKNSLNTSICRSALAARNWLPYLCTCSESLTSTGVSNVCLKFCFQPSIHSSSRSRNFWWLVLK